MAPIRTRTRSRGKARSAPYKKKGKPTVKKIMRILKSNRPETKIAKFTASVVMLNSINSWNIMYQSFAQGSGETQFTGKKVNLKGIEVKYQINNTGVTASTSGFTLSDTRVLVSIIATKTYKTTSSLSYSDIQDDALATNTTYRMNYDIDKCKVLAQRKINLHAMLGAASDPGTGLGGVPRQYSGKMYLRLNKNFVFRDWATSYEAQDLNYYVVIQSNTFQTSSLVASGEAYFSVKTYYTDD